MIRVRDRSTVMASDSVRLNVMNLEFIFTLYNVRTRLDPMKVGVTICGRTPQA